MKEVSLEVLRHAQLGPNIGLVQVVVQPGEVVAQGAHTLLPDVVAAQAGQHVSAVQLSQHRTRARLVSKGHDWILAGYQW